MNDNIIDPMAEDDWGSDYDIQLPDGSWTTIAAYTTNKIIEAKNEEWRAILGVDFDKFYPVDKYQGFISIPSHWINQQISENNMDVKGINKELKALNQLETKKEI